ncbi:HAD family hydrolase [Streptomyces sp. NPDC052415]|uniref:HAD family hydrolase n=1 Tax=Streptomyces sp. NPDC052415 TaxID=3365690 RepID=UPI0037D95AFE
MTDRTEHAPAELHHLIRNARVVLWDFDGPICRLFARYTAERVATDLVGWLEGRGLHDLLTAAERDALDPHVVLRAVDRRHPGSDLVAELEDRLTAEELKATSSAMPTPYADPLIRTLTAVGSRLAIATNNSPRVVRAYLESRDLTRCFTPHIYGRTQQLNHLKPDPDCLNRALRAMGAVPASALMIGDAPTDYFAARAAGVAFLGYARNDRKARLLNEAGAMSVVNSLQLLLRAVQGRD